MDERELLNLKNKHKQAIDAMEKAMKIRKTASTDDDRKKAQKDFDIQKAAAQDLAQQIQNAEDTDIEKGRFEDDDSTKVELSKKKEQEKEAAGVRDKLDDIRGQNSYMKAFQKALTTHQTPDSALHNNDEYGVLTKVLTITGGTTVGEDGGFLVPIDFDKKIIAETKDWVDISTLCNREVVNTNTGWRAVEVAGQRTKLPKVEEMGNIGKNNQPKFRKVVYTLAQYGDRLPVSNPLMQDVDGLMSYLAGWFGPKLILTRNDLILSLLQALPFTAQTATTDKDKVKAIKTILNKELNTAHSRAASLLMGQSTYDEMDNWVDGQGRPMLVPDLSGDFNRFKGRPVRNMDDDEIGTISKTEESATTVYNPLYVGNFRAFATLFDRNVMEMAATNIGGDAWATNSTEIRVICRMDAQMTDNTAVRATGYKQQA